MLLAVGPLSVEGNLFGLTPGPALCGRPVDAASGHLRCDVIPGCAVGGSCAAHEQGDGLAAFGSLQEALHCLWEPRTTAASWSLCTTTWPCPVCPQLVPFVMAPWGMAPSMMVPWVIAPFVVALPVVAVFIVALVCATLQF